MAIATLVTAMAARGVLAQPAPGPSGPQEGAPGATGKTTGERKPVVDARADQLLRNMSDYMAAEKQFTVRADISFDDVLPTGQKIQFSAVENIAVRRPDRAYVEYDSDLGDKYFWYDGSRLTVLDVDANAYAGMPLSGPLNVALDRLLDKYGFVPPLADLLYENPYQVLRPRVQFGIYLGRHSVDGVRCHHLAFVEKNLDWQIWIEDGPRIVPRKLVITYTSVPAAPQYEALLSDWDFGTRLADASFKPLLPPDALQIDFLEVEKRGEKKPEGATR